MRIPKRVLKLVGPLVCRVRGHVGLEFVAYAPGRVQTLTGCTRCLRGDATDRQVGQYPLPRYKRVTTIPSKETS